MTMAVDVDVKPQTKQKGQTKLSVKAYTCQLFTLYSLFPNREPSPIKNHLCKLSHIFLSLDEAKPNLLYC